MKHPASYSENLLPYFANFLKHSENVLDPFAGVGKIALIKQHGFKGKVICNEIETEWTTGNLYDVDEWHVGDAENMDWAANNTFDAICTSPTYGNRMADHFVAKDNSLRITYRHFLGRDLNNQNTGKMQWGNKYRQKHVGIYKECLRVLKPAGVFILNISDHIRKGEVVNVVEWHKKTLLDFSMILLEDCVVETPRMRFGRNHGSRLSHEHILLFEKKRTNEII